MIAVPGHTDSARRPARPSAGRTLRLLVVEDDLLHARLLKANVERPGRVDVELAGSAGEALARLARPGIDAVITDLVMPGADGITLVRRIRETDRSLPVVIMSGQATMERAVEGVRAGATDFLQKPVNATTLLALVEGAVTDAPERAEAAPSGAGPVPGPRGPFGSHPRLDAVRAFAAQVARAPGARVLITGESGTGKSLLARAVHELSGGAGRFVEVNCAAIPPQLLESELFGHEKGAFTDARALKRGLIEEAEGGTLLLDEIDSLPLELQPKLLLFLESRQVRRVGGGEAFPVSARVIAATNADLRRRVAEGAFRRDLLYRLDVASVEMPPLREMPEVIGELAARFVRDLCRELGRPVPETTPASFAGLAAYPWPGNARELRNAVERSLIFHAGGAFAVEVPRRGLEAAPEGARVPMELGLTLEEVERAYLAATLSAARRELASVAEGLGISRKTLWEKRRRYGL